MPYLVALALIWMVPGYALLLLLMALGSDGQLMTVGLFGVVLGTPLAVLLTAVVLPAIALAQAADARARKRARELR